MPANERKIEEIRLHQQEDPVCRKLVEFTLEGWPDRSRLNTTLARKIKHHSSKGTSDERFTSVYSLFASSGYSGQNSLRASGNSKVSGEIT